MKSLTHLAVACSLAATLGTAVSTASAQEWPRQPVKLLVGSAPGGGTDAMARAVADRLGPLLKQSVVVENRPGASNTLAADVTAKSTDGHTFVMGVSTAHAIAPHLLKLGYDNNKDLVPVAFVGAVPNVLVANMALPVTNVADLVKLAKGKPGQLNYASSGNGTVVHLGTEYFKAQANLFLVHIPYRGTALAIPDLVSGKVDVLFDSLPSGLPHVKEGRLRALGITSAKRSALLPDLPAISESVPGYETVTWFGLYGPKGLSAELATRLSTGVNQALQDPDVKERLARLGIDPVGGTPAQFAAMANADRAKWKKIITDRKITAE